MLGVFFIDEDPIAAAQALCDAKLTNPDARILELLLEPCSDHPLSNWMWRCSANWRWVRDYVITREVERSFRGLNVVVTKTAYLAKYLEILPKLTQLEGPPMSELESFPMLMPAEYRREDPVESWRLWYFYEMCHRSGWTNRTPPQWFSMC